MYSILLLKLLLEKKLHKIQNKCEIYKCATNFNLYNKANPTFNISVIMCVIFLKGVGLTSLADMLIYVYY